MTHRLLSKERSRQSSSSPSSSRTRPSKTPSLESEQPDVKGVFWSGSFVRTAYAQRALDETRATFPRAQVVSWLYEGLRRRLYVSESESIAAFKINALHQQVVEERLARYAAEHRLTAERLARTGVERKLATVLEKRTALELGSDEYADESTLLALLRDVEGVRLYRRGGAIIAVTPDLDTQAALFATGFSAYDFDVRVFHADYQHLEQELIGAEPL